jgi:hypothetical protein
MKTVSRKRRYGTTMVSQAKYPAEINKWPPFEEHRGWPSVYRWYIFVKWRGAVTEKHVGSCLLIAGT